MEPAKLNIYFCGSIRGVAANLSAYTALISHLKKFGNVLTEHIVEPSLVAGLDDKGLYQHDWAAFTRADVLIAETTAPSHGVGMELGWAVALKKPVLSLAALNREYNSSALITGCPAITHRDYGSEPEAIGIIEEFLRDHFEWEEGAKSFSRRKSSKLVKEEEVEFDDLFG